MDDNPQYIFIYGTLLSDTNPYGALLKNTCRFHKKGKFKGLLFDIGEYPGAIYQPESDDYVYGSVFIMNDPVKTLRILDDYEGFGEDQPQPNEFIRQLMDIDTGIGLMKCWVYLYNLPVKAHNRIVSGRYLKK